MIDSDAAATIRDQIEIITRLQLDLADERRRSACHQQSATRWALVADRYRQQAIMQNAGGLDMAMDDSMVAPFGSNPRSTHRDPRGGDLPPLYSVELAEKDTLRDRLIAAGRSTP